MADKNLKRGRAQNFTNKEIIGLLDIVSRYKHVVECKETDATTWKDKDDAWNQICLDFNAAHSITVRSKKSLKSKFEGMKKNVKHKITRIRKETITTGGGEDTAPELTSADEKLLAMMPTTIAGLDSINDDDRIVTYVDLQKGIEEESQDIEDEENLGEKSDDEKAVFPLEYLLEYEDIVTPQMTPETFLPKKVSKKRSSTDRNDPHCSTSLPTSAKKLKEAEDEADNFINTNSTPEKKTHWANHKAKDFRKPRNPLLRVSQNENNNKTGRHKLLPESMRTVAEKKIILLDYQLLLVQQDMKYKQEQESIKKHILEVELQIKKTELEAKELELKNLKMELRMK